MSEESGTRKVALKNVRVFDGERIREPSTVVIEGGLIGKPGDIENVEIIGGQGCVLLQGLIDAHVHLHGEENLVQLASHGVTTGFRHGE
jgi:dihydroorotase-like cyclic amidohydrolase